jgi:hypothetical protein
LFVSSPGIVLRIHELPPFNRTLCQSVCLCGSEEEEEEEEEEESGLTHE